MHGDWAVSGRFEWDQNKGRINAQKHGIRFKEAATAFHDPEAMTADDPTHSNEEPRRWLVGESNRKRLRNRSGAFPLLLGEGRARETFFRQYERPFPSSGPPGHLLPRGEGKSFFVVGDNGGPERLRAFLRSFSLSGLSKRQENKIPCYRQAFPFVLFAHG
ncbi:MAG: BrnT family toxin [Elusimicrobia bacterium]|nr:BrnT family toxin [Elusimicrobiota bacterium]